MMNKTFIRMIKDIASYRKIFIIAVLVTLAGAVIDGVIPRLYSWGIDNLIIENNDGYFVPYVIIYLLIVVLSGVSVYAFIRMCGLLEMTFSYNLRNKIFEKVQKLHMQYFNENQDGWIIARMTSDVSKLSEVLAWQFVDSFYFILLIVISIYSIFTYSIKAGGIVTLLYPVLVIVLYIIKEQVLKQYRKVRSHNSNIVSKFNEFINGVLTIKTMAIEKQNLDDFSAESNRLRRHSRNAIMLSGLFVPSILIIGYTMLGVVLGFSINENVLGNLTIGEVTALISYTMILLELTSEITNIISQLQHAQANAERVYSLLDTEELIVDKEEHDSVLDELKDKSRVQGNITFDNVSFAYKDCTNIFSDLSLKFEQGKSVALVGATGSGKTTLVNLISRFYEPTNGDIYFDDINIKDKSQNWLHYNIGHVLQHPFLFDGTVFENIRYNSEVEEEAVVAVCNELGLDSMIEKLEFGIHTNVGEGGSKLSVGEKQLISFARALVNDPSIVILDEATSSIDYDSENIIQEAIYKMMDNRTMIIIAHRLSTIEKCNEILYLKNGKIVEQGNHQELMELKGYYYDLVNVSKTK